MGGAAGTASETRREIGTHRFTDCGIGGHRLVEDLARHHGAQILAADLLGEVVGESTLQPLMLQDGCVDKARKRWLALRQCLGLFAERAPNQVASRYFLPCDGHVCSCAQSLVAAR